MRTTNAAMAIVICLNVSAPLRAAVYYVSPSSVSNDWPAARSVTTPCTPLAAMENTAAGDTVYFRGGTYELGINPNENDPNGKAAILMPENSGTDGAPITFMAYAAEAPVLNATVGTDTAGNKYDGGRLFSTHGKDWIVFDGFTCLADNGDRLAHINIWGEAPNTSDHCMVRNITINGGATVQTSTDNREPVRVDNGIGNVISRCTIFKCA
jgi:hypothetical protein